MSSSEGHRRPSHVRRLCADCRERNAKFRYRGAVRADRDHTLCFQCYRARINRARAYQMVSSFRPSGFAANRPLAPREIAHRQLMLDYLRGAGAVAS